MSSASTSRLSGKAAFVTGGSRGIGAAIVRKLAEDGADVAFTYARSAEKAQALAAEIEAKGRRALAIAADNADAAAVEKAVNEAAAKFGRLDIVVNNAGIFRVGDIASLTLADFDETIAVNVRAAVLATKAAVAHMGEGGRVISIGSTLAERVPFQGMALYSLSKAALIGFTKAIARDLGPRNITANVVHPGSTDTDMNPKDGEHSGDQKALMAIERYADPSEIAGLVAWLASPEARSVTGAGFTVDNGTNA